MYLQSGAETRGDSRRSKRYVSKGMSKSATATSMTASKTDLHELGAACMKRDRMLQQASTNDQEWAKNKLIVQRMQKRVESLRQQVKGEIIIDDVRARACVCLCMRMIFYMLSYLCVFRHLLMELFSRHARKRFSTALHVNAV